MSLIIFWLGNYVTPIKCPKKLIRAWSDVVAQAKNVPFKFKYRALVFLNAWDFFILIVKYYLTFIINLSFLLIFLNVKKELKIKYFLCQTLNEVLTLNLCLKKKVKSVYAEL